VSRPRVHSWLRIAIVAVVASLGGGGCGGFSASKSLSPLDFILPGLMQNTTPQPPVHDGATPTNYVASAQQS